MWGRTLSVQAQAPGFLPEGGLVPWKAGTGATHPPFRGLNFSHFFLVVTSLDSLHSYQEDSLLKVALFLWK